MDHPETFPVIEDVWRCEKCGHETTNKSLLAVHMAYQHQDFKLFKSVQSDHNRFEEGTKSDSAKANAKVRCKKCSYVTSTIADVKLHIKSVHKKVDFKCWYCDFTALTKVQLTEHMNNHGYNTLANASFEPDLEKGDSDSSITVTYQSTKTTPKVDGRDLIIMETNQFASSPTPNSDGGSVSDSGSTIAPLNLAKESTPAPQTLGVVEEHIGNFKCDLCDYTTTILSILARHKKYAHTGKKIRNFPCNQCDHSAINEATLKVHISAVHDKVKNYKCDDCGHMTARRANLMSHMTEVHAKIRNYR